MALIFGLLAGSSNVKADSSSLLKMGPVEVNIPFKRTYVTYLYNFQANKNLVGGETPIITLWDRIEGTFGAVTSLEAKGTPFIGGNIKLGNVLQNYVALPDDISIGGFGGWDFNADKSLYGLKANYKLW
jgi:hypothetical protein